MYIYREMISRLNYFGAFSYNKFSSCINTWSEACKHSENPRKIQRIWAIIWCRKLFPSLCVEIEELTILVIFRIFGIASENIGRFQHSCDKAIERWISRTSVYTVHVFKDHTDEFKVTIGNYSLFKVGIINRHLFFVIISQRTGWRTLQDRSTKIDNKFPFISSFLLYVFKSKSCLDIIDDLNLF